MDEHQTSIVSDGGKNPLYQATCTCGWSGPFGLGVFARRSAKAHRARQRQTKLHAWLNEVARQADPAKEDPDAS